ncbi:MAG: VOC family protein [Candidatus Dormibacteria bacterium]
MIRIDHVLFATTDLQLGARQLLIGHGLESVEGGHHPHWGTANRIAPIGSQYLELVTAYDRELAATNPFGRAVLAEADPDSLRPLAVCLAVDDLSEVALRLGLESTAGSRTLPSGGVVGWRSVGMEAAFSPRRLPFFIEWDQLSQHPSQSGPRNLPLAIARVEVGGDETRLRSWLVEEVAGLELVGGAPGLRGIELSMAAGGRAQLS